MLAGSLAKFARDFSAEWFVNAALERVFAQADLFQHRLNGFDMNRFAAVRSACDGNLLISEAETIGGARSKQGDSLKRLS